MNKRILAGVLAVTTAMTTVGVNVPSSYAGGGQVFDKLGRCIKNCLPGLRRGAREAGRTIRTIGEGAAGSFGGAILYDRYGKPQQPQQRRQRKQSY